MPAPKTTSPAGVADIQRREGCRLIAYLDTKGVLTIGTGHTGRATAPPVTPGMRITKAQATSILMADLKVFEDAVNGALRLPTTQNEFDAMVSLAFNIGGAGFAGSTVVRKFNLGEINAAADAFLLWEKPPELKSRREGERAQFLRTDTAAVAVTVPVSVPEPVYGWRDEVAAWLNRSWHALASGAAGATPRPAR